MWIPFLSAASSSTSPRAAVNCSPLTKKRWVLRMSFHLDPDRPDMPRVPDLRSIESRDAHEHAARDCNVKPALGIEGAGDFERPAPGCPARCAADVGAIAGKGTGDDDAGDHRVERIESVAIGGVRLRFSFGHPPSRAVAF